MWASVVLWYLLISLLGWLTFPLAFRLLPALPERGYAISRILGLLLWGYIFWLLTSLGVLRNDPAGLLFALAILIALSAWACRGLNREEIRAWWHLQKGQVLTVEVLFLVAYVAWVLVRAANPDAVGTEKPMELAFINAILASPTFPPHDPWLSGYAISYYYFGYVIVAMLARLAGTSGGVAFNLGVAAIFALSATGAYGLVYNLLESYLRRRHTSTSSNPPRATLPALFGPLFILLVSNLEGFLHSLHNRGLFWRSDAAGGLTSPFWKWLDILDLNAPPEQPLTWVPSHFWWWWRASRVVRDYDLAGNYKEIIDEFPAFSYLLGDLHPHVLAIPFAFLAMTLALNLLLGGGGGVIKWLERRVNLRTIAWAGTLAIPLGLPLLAAGLLRLKLSFAALGLLLLLLGGYFLVHFRHLLAEHGLNILIRLDLGEVWLEPPLYLSPASFCLGTVVLGGMGFLNTIDFPFYVALFAGAYALQQMIAGHKKFSDALKDFVWLGLALGVAGGLLYLPFYLGFSSQVGGILPNLIYATRGAHLWVMFAPLLLPSLAFLIYQARLLRHPRQILRGLLIALGFVFFLWLIDLFLGLAIVMIPQVGDFYQGTLASPGTNTLFMAALTRRLTSPGGWITLTVLLGLTLGLLLQLQNKPEKLVSQEPETIEQSSVETSPLPSFFSPTHLFTLLLILLGTLLVLGPEFFYLRDQFGWRMNTIFKFYFEAWLLWGIAAAYCTAMLSATLQRSWAVAFQLAIVVLLGMSLVYPVFGVWNKTNGFHPFQWTLDSTAYMQNESADEMSAIRWLESAPPGVVAEAVPPGGGSYTQFARVSTLSGQPAVLGWIGHESQWRGGGEAMGSRQDDLERLYCSRDWNEAQAILDRYSIRYIFIGNLERINYQPNTGNCLAGLVEAKFSNNLKIAFQQGPAIVYEYIAPNSP